MFTKHVFAAVMSARNKIEMDFYPELKLLAFLCEEKNLGQRQNKLRMTVK